MYTETKKVYSRVHGFADYFDNVMTKFIANNRTDALKNLRQFVFYDNKLSLPHLMCLTPY